MKVLDYDQTALDLVRQLYPDWNAYEWLVCCAPPKQVCSIADLDRRVLWIEDSEMATDLPQLARVAAHAVSGDATHGDDWQVALLRAIPRADALGWTDLSRYLDHVAFCCHGREIESVVEVVRRWDLMEIDAYLASGAQVHSRD